MLELKPCPVCGTPGAAFDVVDFNKSCEEHRGVFLPLSGEAVYYHLCGSCGHLFGPQFSDWTEQQFLEKIYNDDYGLVDPDYEITRPESNAEFLLKHFDDDSGHIRHLDYGGGNGYLSEILVESGWDSTSYDPFPANDTRISELGRFNFITAFEVFEHVPDPLELMHNLLGLMDDSCMVMFSTLLSDGFIQRGQRINWWYCSPRNGHISIFSKRSLETLCKRHDVRLVSFGPGTHAFVNKTPSWASKLFPQ